MNNKCRSYIEYNEERFDHLNGAIITTTRGKCIGSKNYEECFCKGDVKKCTFYPEKRKEALQKELYEKYSDDYNYFDMVSVLYNKQPTIYYAHHQWKYGTKIEEYELGLICAMFPTRNIFNPSKDLKTDGLTEEQIMANCYKAIEDCEIVIFSSMDGIIGKGVFNEIEYARGLGKLILYIYQGELRTDWATTRISKTTSDRLYAYVLTGNTRY